MKRCPACQKEYADDVKFCPSDGSSLVADTGGSGDPLVGAMFARKYEIEDKLGEGGFGSVYRARDVDLDVTVALKVAHAHLIRDAKQFERFKLEARLLRRLGDKTRFVPRLYDYGRDDEKSLFYFSLEFCGGRSLQQILIEEGPLEEARAITLMRQVCTALSVAHRENPPVVHRDLKPGNLMLIDRGGVEEIKVLDFGIAKIVGEGSLTDVNRGMPGSYGFMSPEQLDGNVDSRTDLFAAGATMYHLVTGRDPWLGERSGAPLDSDVANQVLLKTYRAEPIHPRQANPKVSKELEQVLLQLLQKRPEDRHQSAAEFDAALEKIQYSFGMPVGGRLLVESHPSKARAKLIRSGSVVARGKTPWKLQQLPPGQYELMVDARKHEEARVQIRIETDEQSRAHVTLQPKTSLATEVRETSIAGLSKAGRAVRDSQRGLGRGLSKAGHAASDSLSGLSRGLRSRPVRRVGIGLVGIAALAGATYLSWEFLRPVDDGGQVLPPRIESVTQQDFYRRLEAGEVSNVIVRDGTIWTALAGQDGDTVEILLSGLGFQGLMRDLRARGVEVTSLGEPDLEIMARESGTGSEIEAARIALRSESVSTDCQVPCPPGETESLPADWYAVGVDSDDWAVDMVELRHAPGAWPVETVELASGGEFYLAGGVSTSLDVMMIAISQTDDSADVDPGASPVETPAEAPAQGLLRQARAAFTAGRMLEPEEESAYEYAKRALVIEPGNPEAEELINEIADWYLRSGRDHEDRGDFERAIASADTCLTVRPSHSQCQSLRDDAAASRSELERARVAEDAGAEALEPEPQIVQLQGRFQFRAVAQDGSGLECTTVGSYTGQQTDASLALSGDGFRLTCERNGVEEGEEEYVTVRLGGEARDDRWSMTGTVGEFQCDLEAFLDGEGTPETVPVGQAANQCTAEGVTWSLGWAM